ncbi:basic proline-rich protein-like [Homarus americanus]|uniref:basic proline-rich protein-like n=1 Tax=Homarus americanus TaxID=6706 RepID=UPI001C477774|nr:basic proline-rich protein-like [Homarus americanus]
MPRGSLPGASVPPGGSHKSGSDPRGLASNGDAPRGPAMSRGAPRGSHRGVSAPKGPSHGRLRSHRPYLEAAVPPGDVPGTASAQQGAMAPMGDLPGPAKAIPGAVVSHRGPSRGDGTPSSSPMEDLIPKDPPTDGGSPICPPRCCGAPKGLPYAEAP